MRRLLQWLAAGGLIVLLCGCVHFYDKTADTAATSAKNDYDASKITEALKNERATLDALEAKEIEAFRKVTLAERNLELLSLLNESGNSLKRTTDQGLVSRFNRLADERLATLLGNDDVDHATDLIKNLSTSLENQQDAEHLEIAARFQLVQTESKFAAMPACNKDVAGLADNPSAEAAAALTKDASFQPRSMPASGTWQLTIKNLGTKCTQLLTAREALTKALRQMSQGQISRATDDTRKQKADLDTQQKNAKAAGETLKKAANDLAAAQRSVKDAGSAPDLACDTPKQDTSKTTDGANAGTTTASDSSKQTGQATNKEALCNAIDNLSKLKDSGIKILSEERIKRINKVLEAMSGRNPPNDELEPSLALLSATSRFAQALNQYQMAGVLPALEPLLIEKQLTSVQLAYAKAGEDLAKLRVQYAQDFLDASLLEVDLLLQAKARLASLGPAPKAATPCGTANALFCASMRQLLENKKLAATAGGAGESASRSAYRALAFLSESYSVARDRQQTAELKLIDTEYRESYLRSEASVAAWNALISVPIDQLKTYHAGGITPQETAQLLQALGLIGIAVRID